MPNVTDSEFWNYIKRKYENIESIYATNKEIQRTKATIITGKKLSADLIKALLISDEDKSIKKISEQFNKNKNSEKPEKYLENQIKIFRKIFFDVIEDENFERNFRSYYDCNLLIMHISYVPFSELRYLQGITFNGEKNNKKKYIDKEYGELRESLDSIGKNEKYIADQIGFTHWYRNFRDVCSPEVPVFNKKQHLYLNGTLKFIKRIIDDNPSKERVIVISEFREEMGSFRNKIAHYINEELLEDTATHALTGDIGMN